MLPRYWCFQCLAPIYFLGFWLFPCPSSLPSSSLLPFPSFLWHASQMTSSSNGPWMVPLRVRSPFLVLMIKPEPFFIILLFINTAIVCFIDTLPCQTEQLEDMYDRTHLRNSKLGPGSEKMFGDFLLNNASSVQLLSRVQLCNPMNRSMPGLPVHHQLPEFTQTHVHQVSDAIQPSHLLSSPSPPAPNPSQHQDLFQWVNSSHEVAKVLEFQIQCQSFQWTPRTGLL